MKTYSVIFASALDALKVGEQLPNAKIVDNQVFYPDKEALELAIALAGVSGYSYESERMHYPEHEFEYTGDSPRIYVRCLSAFACNHLHGLWIDASQHINDIWDNINFMLSWSPVAHSETCEEFAIHSYEGFGSYRVNEFEDLEKVNKVAKAIKEHSLAFADYMACEFPCPQDIDDWDELEEKFQAAYVGHFESEKDFVWYSQDIDEVYNFKALQEQFPFWASHIDWEGVATDLFCTNYYSVKANAEGYGIYVFRNHPNS